MATFTDICRKVINIIKSYLFPNRNVKKTGKKKQQWENNVIDRETLIIEHLTDNPIKSLVIEKFAAVLSNGYLNLLPELLYIILLLIYWIFKKSVMSKINKTKKFTF